MGKSYEYPVESGDTDPDLRDNLAAAGGAALIGYNPSGTVQSNVALRPLTSDLASTALGKGASTVGINDAGGIITATQVEAALQEIMSLERATLEGRLRQRAAAACGTDFAFHFDDLTGHTLFHYSVSAGVANDPTHGPGVWKWDNSNYAALSSASVIVVNAAVTPWYMAGRIRFNSAIAADDRQGVCLFDNGSFLNFLHAGRYQTASGTKFVFTVVKANVYTQVLSTVNLDTTTFHDVEMWFDGTNCYGSVDNETPVLVGAASVLPTATALNPYHGTIVTAAGAGTTMYIDAVCEAAARTAA